MLIPDKQTTHPKVELAVEDVANLLNELFLTAHTGGVKIELNISQGVPGRLYLIEENKKEIRNNK